MLRSARATRNASSSWRKTGARAYTRALANWGRVLNAVCRSQIVAAGALRNETTELSKLAWRIEWVCRLICLLTKCTCRSAESINQTLNSTIRTLAKRQQTARQGKARLGRASKTAKAKPQQNETQTYQCLFVCLFIFLFTNLLVCLLVRSRELLCKQANNEQTTSACVLLLLLLCKTRLWCVCVSVSQLVTTTTCREFANCLLFFCFLATLFCALI